MATKSTITLFDVTFSPLQNTIFQHSHDHQLWIFTRDDQQRACHARKKSTLVEVACCWLCWNVSPATLLCWLLPFGLISVQQASIMSIVAIVCVWRNSVAHLCFICTSMLDAILSGCPSAAICHRAIKCNGILVKGSTSTAIAPTSISDVMGQHHKTGGITFRAAPLYRTRWLNRLICDNQ